MGNDTNINELKTAITLIINSTHPRLTCEKRLEAITEVINEGIQLGNASFAARVAIDDVLNPENKKNIEIYLTRQRSRGKSIRRRKRRKTRRGRK
tara:strand:+ start:1409 stop:1693 length:285 start_codon:yes stop_codon:yes gene_type:complete